MNLNLRFEPPRGNAAAVIGGVEIYTNTWLFEATERIERRVPGGYMNRWLVRQVTHERVVKQRAIHDRINNRIFVHPKHLEQLLKELS